jgi:hypothetical protein
VEVVPKVCIKPHPYVRYDDSNPVVDMVWRCEDDSWRPEGKRGEEKEDTRRENGRE